MEEREAYIALNLVQGVGAVLVRRGVEFLGSATAFFEAAPSELAKLHGVGTVRSANLARQLRDADPRAEMRRAEGSGVKLVTFVDPQYPPLLKAIHDPPLVLYVSGNADILKYGAVAVVGTRAPTIYGRDTARRMSFQLAQAGLTVISGLARGIDTEAHRAALQAGGRTVAVLGSALDRLYPAENRDLARKIVADGGAVISEYPFGRQADRQTFPMRNRIVSGLCGGVLVVEAGLTSGTLITADQALEQGRAVMAVPGRIDTPSAQGCHRLLRQGARLVECLDDILDELQSLPVKPAEPGVAAEDAAPPATKPAPRLDAEDESLLSALAEGERSVEELIQVCGLPPNIVGARLMGLEMKRLVRRLPGGVVAAVRD